MLGNKLKQICKTWLATRAELAVTAAVLGFVFFAPRWAQAVDGSAVVAGGGTVSFTGASSTNWVKGAEGGLDLLLVYTNAEETAASFTFAGLTSARMLAVGGGGGGGGIFTHSTYGGAAPYGGGGGGGAGGFIEIPNQLYSAETFTVNVGTGGVAGVGNGTTSKATADFSGGEGGDTTIKTNGFAMVTAYGGGGGGGQRAGHDGASGGGGSYLPTGQKTGEMQLGGVAKDDGAQGHDGGAGDEAALFGGGGGGAGGPGKPGSTASTHGTGGDGKASDIAVDAGTPESEWPWYAGGGGGGNATKGTTKQDYGIAGGKGGGGQGGNGRSPNAPTATTPGGDAEPGDDGTGGGGGGAGKNSTTAAQRGGCGAVIVRVTGSLNGALEKPTDSQAKYNGEFHPIFAPSPFLKVVSGPTGGTEVGVYTAQVEPVGTTWKGGGSEPVTVTLVIYEADGLSGEELVTGAPVKYAGADEVRWIDNGDGTQDLLLKFTKVGSYTFPGSTSARVLAIGGGGGGGGIFTHSTYGGAAPYAGGGGGGAGGMLEVTNVYSELTYVVNVGTGGVAGVGNGTTSKAAEDFSGGDGGDTTITTNGIAMMTAYGGGGGGGQRHGHDGASGGGGAYKPTGQKTGDPQNGGTGILGQGHNGGAGDVPLFGGGGGGAGGPGMPGSTADTHGTGGDGRQSSITNANNAAKSDWGWFAGGGGGGNATKGTTGQDYGIAGGKGGGGQGGNGRSPNARTETTPGGDAEPGVDGTGGGGGGAGKNTAAAAGKGGSGVVYVRISSSMRGEFKRPTSPVVYTYDGEEHGSIYNNVFYDVEGQNVGTNAGTYVAWAKLHPGVVWPEGGNEDVEVTMIIEKLPVTISDLTIKNWEIGATPKEPSCRVDPSWVEVQYAYAKAEAGKEPGEIAADKWSPDKPSTAGKYWVRATAPDDGNYECEPAYFGFEVTKIMVRITELRIRDWEVGAPASIPHCTVEPADVIPSYEWRVKNEELGEWKKWDEGTPTELGTYLLRAVPPNFDDYELTPDSDEPVSFSIVKGLGGSFTDYVEIEIAGYAGETLVNFPYRLELSETHPVGFLYARAPFDGQHMAFTDSTGDTILPYEVRTWVTNGASVIYVQVPSIGKDPQKIRLYWHERPDAAIPTYDPTLVWKNTEWTEETAAAVTPPPPGISFPTPVSSDGKLINYWKQDAVLTAKFWDVGDPPETKGKLTQNALLAYGLTLRVIIHEASGLCETNVVDGSTSNVIPVDEPGNFRISYFQGDDIDHEYTELEQHVDYAVTGSAPFDDLRGNAKTLTLSGRVMLANDDWLGRDKPDDAHAVTDQSWWQTREVVTNETTGATMTNDVYWTHGGEEHGTYASDSHIKNMLPGTDHALRYMGGSCQTGTLWRLSDVIIGNLVRDDKIIYATQCLLPLSSTALGITSFENYANQGDILESGNLILRNKKEAAIYSPCYTNGIGTIYFDAVNSTSGDHGSDYYQFVVEVVTKSSFGGIEPLDENVSMENPRTVAEELGKINADQWKVYEMQPFERFGTGAKLNPCDCGKVTVFAPDVSVGGTSEYFYRFCVPVNCREACRFRIRRLQANESAGRTADNGSLILVDNILVSYPQMRAVLKPDGKIEKKESTKLILGQENAFEPPFPSVKDASVIARGVPDTEVTAATNVNPKGLIAFAKMHYRWNYLDQAPQPWASVDLEAGNDFRAETPLVFPRHEGDLEFWYESFVNVPFYTYYDYSGLGIGLSGPGDKPLYSEQVSVSTNGYSNPFFVRLRAARSDLESFRLIVKKSAADTPRAFEMMVHDDRLWRGYYPTPDPVEGDDGKGLYVRFEAWNRQTPGEAGFASNVTLYTLEKDLDELKLPVSLKKATSSNEWSRVVCDAETAQILFQLNEESLAATVVHGDYQDFNLWNDANRTGAGGKPLFVGTSTDTNEMTGVSSVSRDFPMDMGRWIASKATSDYWSESFLATEKEMATAGGEYEVFKRFTDKDAKKSRNGFSLGSGQYVPSAYRDNKSGEAFQMEGSGNGYIMFVNAAELPRGIESISFKPRLAQTIAFDDFTFYEGDMTLNNYTFYCRAAYDINERKDFTGNASLSLVAFYRTGKGCYELRVEQENAVINSGVVTGPGTTQRLSLYKWRYDAAAEDYRPTLLGTTTVSGSNMLKTKGEDGNYALLFISAKSTATATEICAGVSTGVDSVGSKTSPACRWVAYSDTDAGAKYGPRFKNGGYGIGSANCPARFRYLKCSPSAQSLPSGTGTDKWYAGTKDATFTLPTSGVSCNNAIQDDFWSIKERRVETIDIMDGTKFGFRQVPVEQTVYVLKAPSKSTDFDAKNPLCTKTISNFGAVDPVTLSLRTLTDCSVKIVTGAGRTDVVVDDIEIRQWRGESYDESYVDASGREVFNQSAFDDIEHGSPSNFVFTQSWIWSNATTQVKSTELNARRSDPAVATGLRSPWMDGVKGRGLGLGMFGFTYTNAQANAKLLLQLCTNGVDTSILRNATKEPTRYWETVETFDFSKMDEETRKGGTVVRYFGLHGVTGAFRVILDPDVVKAVATESDTNRFGSVTITGAVCHDEPSLDRFAWWGWNLQTSGLKEMLGIYDTARGEPLRTGMAFGLNNSVKEDIVTADEELYPAHLPFLQTPTYRTEIAGEVSFKARKYYADDANCRVTLYGARKGTTDDDRQWEPLTYWTVKTNLFTTFSFKTPQGGNYCAFRFAVTGVPGVKDEGRMPPIDPETDPVRRVLIDEVQVTEAVRARVSFRNVAAFRTDLDRAHAIPNIMDRAQQPLCKESWGVQAEIYSAQLAEVVDLDQAKVRLWWYVGEAPWGFEQWKTKGGARNAWLARCGDAPNVFRSAYFDAPGSVVGAEDTPTAVQYMLEVVYYNKEERAMATNRLESVDWQTPSWYAPLDYNLDYGHGQASRFSAYTILDTVAPGWAWINEFNIFNDYNWNLDNTDAPYQFLEIAAPYDADLTDWTVRFVDAKPNSQGKSTRIVTNEVARFGTSTLPGLKKVLTGMDPKTKTVFHVIASPQVTSFDPAIGEIDGRWKVKQSTDAVYSSGELSSGYPIAVQLVRPSGVVEHEIVARGTNDWASLSYDPAVHVSELNRQERGGRFFYIGDDNKGAQPGAARGSRSLGVHYGNGGTEKTLAEDASLYWNSVHQMTPGFINGDQVINENCPRPLGSAVAIVSQISTPHLRQTFGDGVNTNGLVMVTVRKGDPKGTNITYHVDRWYALSQVMTNWVTVADLPAPTGYDYVLNVGRNVSNDVTVVASADITEELQTKYGLGPDNRYREAVVDWLARGETMYGPFKGPLKDTDEVGIGEYHSLSSSFVTNLNLTAMYWLDMDPTWNDGDLWLMADSTKIDLGTIAPDVRMKVKMVITNTSELAEAGLGPNKQYWAPYVLRGATPGLTSWDYAEATYTENWGDVTFKVTGLLNNGLTVWDNRESWLPLRWFVFTEGSFDANFETEIDIADPLSTESPGYTAGWSKWVEEHPEVSVGFMFRWDIDNRKRPTSIELLKPTNPR